MAVGMSILKSMVSNEKKKSFFPVHGQTSRNSLKTLLIEFINDASWESNWNENVYWSLQPILLVFPNECREPASLNKKLERVNRWHMELDVRKSRQMNDITSEPGTRPGTSTFITDK